MDSRFKTKRGHFCAKSASSTLTSNQLSAKRCSNVILLLCTAKTKRVQSLMGTLAWIDLTSIILEADLGHL